MPVTIAFGEGDGHATAEDSIVGDSAVLFRGSQLEDCLA